MQHRSDDTPVRELPALWGGYLVGRLRTDLDSLNRTLVRRPNGRPFKLMENPSPLLPGGYSRIFQRVVEKGHWPDHDGYSEYWDTGDKYNLLERVEVHLPGSADYLFPDLRRLALELPHDLRDIQERIASCLERFGLARIHTAASLLIMQVVPNSVARRDEDRCMSSLYLPALSFLATSSEPLHTTILTLLRQEEGCIRFNSLHGYLKAYCLRGWSNLLRRPELRFDLTLFRRSLNAVRNVLACIDHGRILGPSMPPSTVAQAMMPICPIWQPTPERLEAETTLCHFYYTSLFEEAESPQRRPLTWRGSSTLPHEINEAFALVFTGIRAADTCWSEWERARPPSTSLNRR